MCLDLLKGILYDIKLCVGIVGSVWYTSRAYSVLRLLRCRQEEFGVVVVVVVAFCRWCL